jgi:hypothetical protein
VSGLHDQDFIYNGKKLVNPLSSPVKTLQLSDDMALHELLGQVFRNYTLNEYGLKLEDIQRTDRQN